MQIYQKIYEVLKQVENQTVDFKQAFIALSLLCSELEEGSRIMGMLEKYAQTEDDKDLLIVLMFLERKLSLALKDEDLLASLSEDATGQREPLDLIIIFDSLRSAWNIGNMIRSSEALLAKEIWLSGYTSGIDQPKVAKAALGAEKHIVIKDFKPEFIKKYKSEGYKVYGFETITNAKALNEISFTEKAIFIFGNERFGISKEMKQYIDEYVYIPMMGLKRSINVGNALAISLYDFMRQSGKL